MQIRKYLSIYEYATTSTKDAVFVIGGMNNGKTIAEYKNRKWTNVGELEKIRFQTRSITFGGQAMIFDLEKKTHHIRETAWKILPWTWGIFNSKEFLYRSVLIYTCTKTDFQIYFLLF